MNYYVEITLLPTSDFNLFSLWSKTFQQIHLGLVEMQNEHGQVPIGVSFPEYQMDGKFGVLGGKLRLFARDEETLALFDTGKWLSRLSDYIDTSSIRPVPATATGYAIFLRKQPKVNPELLARRYAKRHDVNYETALKRYDTMEHRTVELPFIRLKSLSRGQEFCLWIEKNTVSEAIGGSFSSYGLSSSTTVPEF